MVRVLRIVYFEAAAGRGVFAWLDGSDVADDETVIGRLRRILADVLTEPRLRHATIDGRVVAKGDRVLIETMARPAGSDEQRPAKVTVVADLPTADLDRLSWVADQAVDVTRQVGLVLDRDSLARALLLGARRAAPDDSWVIVVILSIATVGLYLVYYFLKRAFQAVRQWARS